MLQNATYSCINFTPKLTGYYKTKKIAVMLTWSRIWISSDPQHYNVLLLESHLTYPIKECNYQVNRYIYIVLKALPVSSTKVHVLSICLALIQNTFKWQHQLYIAYTHTFMFTTGAISSSLNISIEAELSLCTPRCLLRVADFISTKPKSMNCLCFLATININSEGLGRWLHTTRRGLFRTIVWWRNSLKLATSFSCKDTVLYVKDYIYWHQ